MRGKICNPLLDRLRNVIRHMADEGGGHASEAADLVIAAEPRLFALHSQGLARNQLITLARREMKKMAELSMAIQEARPFLAGFDLGNLPTAICIPDAGGDTLYRPMRKAKISELRSAIGMRRKQISEDIAVANRLIELLDLRVSQGAREDDFVLPDDPPGPDQQIAA